MSEKPADPKPSLPDLAAEQVLGILPLRNTVVYPHMPHQLTAGRERSLRALEAAPEGPQTIGIFTQRQADVEEPALDDIYPVGTIAKIHRMWRLPDGSVRLIVQGLERGVLQQVTQTDPYLQARVLPLADEGDESSTAAQALMRTVNAQFQAVIDL
ncbi:MAG: LON peptidase substrate-binding domain-containing protein, partial [Candidatus Latescibacteria bacterium]|nr:LON peptidase substrate-binding domain-containing protein [Candidatus Latescibacterota bacterium]